MSKSARRRRRKRQERVPKPSRPVAVPPPIPWTFVVRVRFANWLVPVALLAGAWIALTSGLDQRNLARDSQTWPTTTGVVIAADMGIGGGRGYTYYHPHLTYSFTVNGKSYVADVIRAGGVSYSVRGAAFGYLNQHAVGSTVEVWYDPDNPSRAVLEPGGGEGWQLYAGGGVVGLIAGTLLLVWTAREEWLRITYARAEQRQASATHEIS